MRAVAQVWAPLAPAADVPQLAREAELQAARAVEANEQRQLRNARRG